jgi:hypothetical protein
MFMENRISTRFVTHSSANLLFFTNNGRFENFAAEITPQYTVFNRINIVHLKFLVFKLFQFFRSVLFFLHFLMYLQKEVKFCLTILSLQDLQLVL